jgi:hypothetical protein
MNISWENGKSLTSRTHVLSKGEVTVVASNSIRHRQGILELTRIDDEYEDIYTCRKTVARVHSHPICLDKLLNKENTHGRESAPGRLHSRQNAMNRVMSDRPPSQPRRRHEMSGGPSSIAVKENLKDPGADGAHEQGNSAFERLQQSDSKWSSGSGALTDRPPLQPFCRHGISGANCASTKESHEDPSLEEPRRGTFIRRHQQSDASRWSSGYRATFDIAPSRAFAHRQAVSQQ